MLKVLYGQDPYSVIGKYMRDHITVIEDIIAVIEIDGIITNQLFMVDMDEENYFIWNNDWYEGEKDVELIDFFPVSEAINPSAEPLTDTEQRIFLKAISREEEVCRKVDAEWGEGDEECEINLVHVCHEIVRKVKGALWT